MKLFLSLIVIHLFLSACSSLATGAAETTGLSLLHDRRTSMALAKDERIEINSAIELNSHDDTRNQCHFNVTAYNGIVLLTGEAPTEQLRNKIVSIVRTIPDVRVVQNRMTIALPSSFSTRSHDTLITTKVKSALSNVKNLPGFDATRVKVVTESGVVYLLGLMHRNEGHVATEIARRQSGVKMVVKVFEYIK